MERKKSQAPPPRNEILPRLKVLTADLAAEVAFREERLLEFLAEVFDEIETPIIIFDEACRVLFYNKWIYDENKKRGHQVDLVIGQPCWKLVGKNEMCVGCPVPTVLAEKKVGHFERIFTTKENRVERYQSVLIPIKKNGVSAIVEIVTRLE